VADVVQGAATGAAVGAFGGAVSAVGAHVGDTTEPTVSTPQEEEKENDSPQIGESSAATA